MLFESARHEPLTEVAWDAARARDAIRAIVEDTEATMGPGSVWPLHPLDGDEAPASGFKSTYFGAAGTLWAQWYLAREGAVELRSSPVDLMGSVHASYLAAPDTGEIVPSYFLGEAGILFVLWQMTRSQDAADRLWACIERNIPNPTNEALWAAPGTMVGAWHMHELTGEGRWRDLFLANVEQLWRTWLPSTNAPCHLWTQDLYGEIVQLLGAGHGFAGNVYPLLRGAALLDNDRREQLLERCATALASTAIRDGDAVNWPPGVGAPRKGRSKVLMQWCHGSPGIVTGAGDFPIGTSADMDAMLVAAGNAVWNAGPLVKGPGVCHGTAGNGYAFLKLYQRNGDALWLERARAFAMHSIAQGEHMREQYGQGRYSLWTGDPGLAVYLWHCVVGSGGLPGLDTV